MVGTSGGREVGQVGKSTISGFNHPLSLACMKQVSQPTATHPAPVSELASMNELWSWILGLSVEEDQQEFVVTRFAFDDI